MEPQPGKKYVFFYEDRLLSGRYMATPDTWACTKRLLMVDESGGETRYWVEPKNLFLTLEQLEERIQERLKYWGNQQDEIRSAKRMREELLDDETGTSQETE